MWDHFDNIKEDIPVLDIDPEQMTRGDQLNACAVDVSMKSCVRSRLRHDTL